MFFIYNSARDNNVILYISLFLVSVVNYFITYYFSGATIHLVYQNLTKGQSDLKEAWKLTGQRSGQILTVAAISAFITTIRNFANKRGNGVFGIVAGIAAWIIQSIWTIYSFFVLPLVMVENMSVSAAVKRSTYIIKNNLLLIGVSYVGLGLVVGLISFVVFIIAAMGAVLLFLALYKISTIVAFVVALLLFVLVLALLSAFSSYVRTAYYTCLVVWVQSVEKQGATAMPPAPLRRVLDKRMQAA
jgi:membrane-anchored glycerophosphoryl diester phosphodiesterase (GDPDase)